MPLLAASERGARGATLSGGHWPAGAHAAGLMRGRGAVTGDLLEGKAEGGCQGGNGEEGWRGDAACLDLAECLEGDGGGGGDLGHAALAARPRAASSSFSPETRRLRLVTVFRLFMLLAVVFYRRLQPVSHPTRRVRRHGERPSGRTPKRLPADPGLNRRHPSPGCTRRGQRPRAPPEPKGPYPRSLPAPGARRRRRPPCRSARHQATSRRRPLRSEEHTSELQSPCNLVCR